MRKLSAFNFITLDGYLNDPDGDISWHVHGEEENGYARESLQAGNILLFGRKTYELMAAYWPTPMALQNDPEVARLMNHAQKMVVSSTLKNPIWKNTKVIKGNAVEEIHRLKESPGNDLTILGSGSLVTQLAASGLIDEYQIMIDPVVIGDGIPIFKGIKDQLRFRLTNARVFNSGVVLLRYTQ